MMKHRLINGDCLKVLPTLGDVDCIFADPPDNIGLGYDHYNDKLADAEYVKFLEDVLTWGVLRAKVVWFSFNAKWTFEVGRIFASLIYQYASGRGQKGLTLSGKACVQVFTFGQHNKNDLGNNHRPLWRLMWSDAPLYPDAIKVPSWRQRNGDKRAAPGGRVPGDVFDMQYPYGPLSVRAEEGAFTVSWPVDSLQSEKVEIDDPIVVAVQSGDVFDFPRVTGNSKQRCDWHPTQLHEELVERCIRLTTKEGDSVLDPFGGTGTTLRVCDRINRNCTIIELDPKYCQHIRDNHPKLTFKKIAA